MMVTMYEIGGVEYTYDVPYKAEFDAYMRVRRYYAIESILCELDNRFEAGELKVLPSMEFVEWAAMELEELEGYYEGWSEMVDEAIEKAKRGM